MMPAASSTLCAPQDIASQKATALHAEIRNYVRGLDKKERRHFVETTIKGGDLETTHAVVNNLPYLSGLTPADQDLLRETAHAKFAPNEHRQINAAKRAEKALENAGMIFTQHYEAALPKIPNKVTAADKAMSALRLMKGSK